MYSGRSFEALVEGEGRGGDRAGPRLFSADLETAVETENISVGSSKILGSLELAASLAGLW